MKLGLEATKNLHSSDAWDELGRSVEDGDEESAPLLGHKNRAALPLSHAQERLWFLDRLEEGTSTEYNLLAPVHLAGELNRVALERAINTIIERHDTLRASFKEQGEGPVQIIEPALLVHVPLVDLTGLGIEEREAAARTAMQQELRTAFDLSRSPLLRIKVLKLGERQHILVRTRRLCFSY